MPKKKAEFPRADDEYEEIWDIRKIAIGILVIILLLFGGLIVKRLILGESIAPSSFIPKIPSFKNVLGTSTSPQPVNVSFSLPTQQNVQQQIHTIQQQVTHLNVAQIASSSPQVRQIIQQIENLPNATSDQAKQACYRLCDNL